VVKSAQSEHGLAAAIREQQSAARKRCWRDRPTGGNPGSKQVAAATTGRCAERGDSPKTARLGGIIPIAAFILLCGDPAVLAFICLIDRSGMDWYTRMLHNSKRSETLMVFLLTWYFDTV
jgi:hypothetical protein